MVPYTMVCERYCIMSQAIVIYSMHIAWAKEKLMLCTTCEHCLTWDGNITNSWHNIGKCMLAHGRMNGYWLWTADSLLQTADIYKKRSRLWIKDCSAEMVKPLSVFWLLANDCWREEKCKFKGTIVCWLLPQIRETIF